MRAVFLSGAWWRPWSRYERIKWGGPSPPPPSSHSLEDPRENFVEILNAALCDLVHIFVANANIIVSKYFESTIIFTTWCYAKSSIATASCLSVRPFLWHWGILITYVGILRKLFSRLISLFRSLHTLTSWIYSKGRSNRLTSRISAGTGVGFGKTGCSEQLYNMYETEQDTANVTISCLY